MDEYPKHPNECPRVDRSFTPNPDFNTPVDFKDSDGVYRFYSHFDGFDKTYNAQFCAGGGRMRDVFRCLNKSEWEVCPHFRR